MHSKLLQLEKPEVVTHEGDLLRAVKARLRVEEISAADESFIAKQKNILHSAARLCKKKGLLIYATCSLLDEENEEQVKNFLLENSDFRLISKSVILEKYGVALDDKKYLKLNPFENDTDGFFGAVMERVR